MWKTTEYLAIIVLLVSIYRTQEETESEDEDDFFFEMADAKLYNEHPDLDFITRVITDNPMDM